MKQVKVICEKFYITTRKYFTQIINFAEYAYVLLELDYIQYYKNQNVRI